MKTLKTTLIYIALVLVFSLGCYGNYLQLTQHPERMITSAY